MTNKKLIKDIKQEQIKTFSNFLKMVNMSKSVPKEQQKKDISLNVITYLKETGVFYKTKNQIFYFFDNDLKTLFNIHKQDFKYLLNIIFQVNESTDLYKYLIAELESYMSENSIEVEIYNFSYYDIQNNTLYIHNNWVEIIKITKDKIEKVDNWYKWLIFETNSLFERWNLLEDELLEGDNIEKTSKNDLNNKNNLNNNKNHLKEIIKTINFDTDSKIQKEDYLWLLENYIYSIFFPNILNTRPILAFIWNKWSWKSFFLKLLLYIFYWKETSLTNLPSNDEEFKNSLMNNYLYFIDNLDDSITKTKVDILCSVATGVWIKKRILYTTSNELNVKINSFIAITSRTPRFKRVDLNERLLIFKLESLKTYVSETELFWKINRDKTMTNLVFHLQKIIQKMWDFKYHKTNFRLADFSNLILNLDIDNIWQTEISKKLDLFTKEQEEFTLESEPIVDLLEILIQENNNNVSRYTAKQLHNRLKEISSKSFMNWTRIPYHVTTPISLWKKLRELESWLQTKFIFNIFKWHSNMTFYDISSKTFE